MIAFTDRSYLLQVKTTQFVNPAKAGIQFSGETIMSFRTLNAVLALAAVTLLTIACDSDSDTPTTRVLLFVNGDLGDQSFFDSAQRGVLNAEQEMDITAETIEAGYDSSLWEPRLSDALNQNRYDVVVLGTQDMTSRLETLAPVYPNVKFIFFDGAVDPAKCANQCVNVYSMSYKQNEGAYLAGVYAAAMTTQPLPGMNPEPMIGSVGGQENPVILDFMVGYEQGARDTNSQVIVLREFAYSWHDPAKGKALAKDQYRQGADLIFQIAGGAGQGVFAAAAEEGKYAIGVDSDQAMMLLATDPTLAQRILTSMVKDIDQSVVRALALHQAGQLPYGQAETLGLAEGGVSLARNPIYDQATPEEVKQRVAMAEQKIIAGEIKVDTAIK